MSGAIAFARSLASGVTLSARRSRVEASLGARSSLTEAGPSGSAIFPFPLRASAVACPARRRSPVFRAASAGASVFSVAPVSANTLATSSRVGAFQGVEHGFGKGASPGQFNNSSKLNCAEAV